MSIREIISKEEYNTALFEVGCEILEERYGYRDAQQMMQRRGCWNWLQAQREIAGRNLYNILKCSQVPGQTEKIHRLYRHALRAHLEVVYFPERLKHQLLQKEVCNG